VEEEIEVNRRTKGFSKNTYETIKELRNWLAV